MTGTIKLVAVGAVTAFSALTALRLSRIKKDLKTRVGLPKKAELIRGLVRLDIPVTIYNYTGFKLTPKRLRIELTYPAQDGSETLLAISPQQTQVLELTKDGVINPVFQIDVDPTTLLGLKQTTPITVSIKFDYFFFPIDIATDIRISDFIPTSLSNSLSSTINSFLKKFGLGNPAYPQWKWENTAFTAVKKLPCPLKPSTPIIPINGYFITQKQIADCL